MPVIIDGQEVKTTTPDKKLGKDEQMILDALHGRGELGQRLKKDLKKNKDKAKYKIEIQFMKARSAEAYTPNLFSLEVWESGRRLHGGGDQRMVFCGYWPQQGYRGEEECGKPITDDNFAVNHLVCPHCNREQFLDAQVKQAHIHIAKQERSDVSDLEKMPIVNPLLVGKMSPKKMSVFMVNIFRKCDSNADIYMKFHPTDIRCRDVAEVKKIDLYAKARRDRTERKENRGLVNYPLNNIIKDTTAGASLESRFLAMIRA